MEYDEAVRERLMAHPPLVCACCGRALDYAARTNGHNEAVPSLDRVDNHLGYTPANTVVTCRGCNRLKGNATLQDLDMIRRYIERHSVDHTHTAALADEAAARAIARTPPEEPTP